MTSKGAVVETLGRTERGREEETAKALYTQQRGRWAVYMYLFGEGDWVMTSRGVRYGRCG